MKLKYIIFAFLSLTLVLGMIGCARMPAQEMDNAREAVFRAENDEDAVLFGGTHLARARDALRRMQVEADSRRFETARAYAAEAVVAAERAIAEGRQAAGRARNEAETLVAGLRPEFEETERNVNGARYHLLDLDHNQLRNDLNMARDTVDMAETAHANGDFNYAIENGRRARAVMGDINGRISAAAPRGKS